MLIPVVTFVAVAALIFGAYWIAVGHQESDEQRVLRRRLKGDVAPVSLDRQQVLLKAPRKFSGVDGLNVALNRSGGFAAGIQDFVDGSGVSMTVGTFLLLSIAAGLLVAVVANIYLGVWWVTLPVSLAAVSGPYLAVSAYGSYRIRKFEEQFPEAVDLIARSMRAGHAFATGIRMAADELPAPAGPEFKLLYDRQNFGAQMADALRSFAERVPTLDARFFVTAVLTQREAGGNLAEILDRLAAVMRERVRIKREVRTRSAHGRMTAYVLAGMPPALALFMTFVNPDQMRLLLTDPLGIRIILGAVGLQVVGIIIVRRIVDIQY